MVLLTEDTGGKDLSVLPLHGPSLDVSGKRREEKYFGFGFVFFLFFVCHF